jgi:hypothetical protein
MRKFDSPRFRATPGGRLKRGLLLRTLMTRAGGTNLYTGILFATQVRNGLLPEIGRYPPTVTLPGLLHWPTRCSKSQHDLAEGGVGFEMFMGGTNLVDRIRPIDQWPNEPANDQRQNMRGKAPGGLGFFASGTRAQDGAQESEAACA